MHAAQIGGWVNSTVHGVGQPSQCSSFMQQWEGPVPPGVTAWGQFGPGVQPAPAGSAEQWTQPRQAGMSMAWAGQAGQQGHWGACSPHAPGGMPSISSRPIAQVGTPGLFHVPNGMHSTMLHGGDVHGGAGTAAAQFQSASQHGAQAAVELHAPAHTQNRSMDQAGSVAGSLPSPVPENSAGDILQALSSLAEGLDAVGASGKGGGEHRSAEGGSTDRGLGSAMHHSTLSAQEHPLLSQDWAQRRAPEQEPERARGDSRRDRPSDRAGDARHARADESASARHGYSPRVAEVDERDARGGWRSRTQTPPLSPPRSPPRARRRERRRTRSHSDSPAPHRRSPGRGGWRSNGGAPRRNSHSRSRSRSRSWSRERRPRGAEMRTHARARDAKPREDGGRGGDDGGDSARRASRGASAARGESAGEGRREVEALREQVLRAPRAPRPPAPRHTRGQPRAWPSLPILICQKPLRVVCPGGRLLLRGRALRAREP